MKEYKLALDKLQDLFDLMQKDGVVSQPDSANGLLRPGLVIGSWALEELALAQAVVRAAKEVYEEDDAFTDTEGRSHDDKVGRDVALGDALRRYLAFNGHTLWESAGKKPDGET